MATDFKSLQPEHEAFIKEQKMFFVGTAGAQGTVNISPKGYDVFRILSPNKVAYLDLTGSGNETSAHLSVNNRITYMFISFQEKPLILRLYGDGLVILPHMAEWEEASKHFNMLPGARQIIVSNIELVKAACGFSVPFYTFEGERNTLLNWAQKQGETGLEDYRKRKNTISMDGILTPLGKKQG